MEGTLDGVGVGVGAAKGEEQKEGPGTHMSRWAWLPPQAGDLPSEGLSQGQSGPGVLLIKLGSWQPVEREGPPGPSRNRAPVSPHAFLRSA